MTTGGPKATKHDVELRRIDARFELQRIALYAASTVFVLLVSSLPLWIVARMVEDLAGKDTNVNVAVAFSVTTVASLTVTGVQFIKGARRKRTIKRLRARLKTLEGQAGIPGADE